MSKNKSTSQLTPSSSSKKAKKNSSQVIIHTPQKRREEEESSVTFHTPRRTKVSKKSPKGSVLGLPGMNLTTGATELFGKFKLRFTDALTKRKLPKEEDFQKAEEKATPIQKRFEQVAHVPTTAEKKYKSRRQELLECDIEHLEESIKNGAKLGSEKDGALALKILVHRIIRGEFVKLREKKYYDFFCKIHSASYDNKSEKGKKTIEKEAGEAFIEAVKDNNTYIIDRLISELDDELDPHNYRAAININKKDSSGKTPLLFAIENGSIGAANRLLGMENIDVTIADNNGTTPLIAAIFKGQNQIAIKILDDIHTRADKEKHIEAVDHEGYSALKTAVFSFNIQLIKKLLEAGAKTITQNNSNILIDLLAAKADSEVSNEYLETIKFLLPKVSLSQVNNKGQNVALMAAKTGDPEIMELVYQKQLRKKAPEQETLEEVVKDFDKCVAAIKNIIDPRIRKLDAPDYKESKFKPLKDKFKEMRGKTTEQQVQALLDNTLAKYGDSDETLIINAENILLAVFNQSKKPTSDKSQSLRDKILDEYGIEKARFTAKEDQKEGESKAKKPSSKTSARSQASTLASADHSIAR